MIWHVMQHPNFQDDFGNDERRSWLDALGMVDAS